MVRGEGGRVLGWERALTGGLNSLATVTTLPKELKLTVVLDYCEATWELTVLLDYCEARWELPVVLDYCEARWELTVVLDYCKVIMELTVVLDFSPLFCNNKGLFWPYHGHRLPQVPWCYQIWPNAPNVRDPHPVPVEQTEKKQQKKKQRNTKKNET